VNVVLCEGEFEGVLAGGVRFVEGAVGRGGSSDEGGEGWDDEVMTEWSVKC
jgi:hypothetical protein